MIRIETICNNISNNIATELSLGDDKKAVINYGVFALIQIVFSIILVMIFGAIFNVFIEALIISFVISILRKSSGGVHASSPGICAFVGTLVSVVMAIVVKKSNISLTTTLILGFVTFVWSYYTVYKLAPVDSDEKPIKKIEKRKRLKKSSIQILTVYLIIAIVNIISFYVSENVNLLVYSGCIYVGLLWQVFSLTKSGHLVLGKIDALFK